MMKSKIYIATWMGLLNLFPTQGLAPTTHRKKTFDPNTYVLGSFFFLAGASPCASEKRKLP